MSQAIILMSYSVFNLCIYVPFRMNDIKQKYIADVIGFEMLHVPSFL